MSSIFNIFLGREEKEMISALETYFNKIDTPLYYAKNPYLVKQFENQKAKCFINIFKEKYIFRRDEAMDFEYFRKKFGFELPASLKTYALLCHPCVIGFHPENPFAEDAVILQNSYGDDCIFQKCLADGKYIVIGKVAYWKRDIVLERETGKIFIIFDEINKNDYVFREAAENIYDFISEIEPYYTGEDEDELLEISATLRK